MAQAAAVKTFLSCVTGEFRSCRLRLANQLEALRGRPFEVKVQEDFRQGGSTLLEALADYIRACDLVIHLAGDACGDRPTAEHVRALYQRLGDAPPDPLPQRSYTQWEYHLAVRFGKKALVYLAAPDAPRECGLPVQQAGDAARIQREHLAFIKASGKHYKTFASPSGLVREVFYDLGLEPDAKVNNLPYKSLGALFKGREDFLKRIRDALGGLEHRGHRRAAAITAAAPAATVHGLGGIGKTRAAVEYAHRHADQYTALLFVRADSPAALRQNLAALCGPMVLDLPEKDARETDVQADAALAWLREHPGWFLIFDNVDTEDAAREVEGLLARLSPAGHVLITSRLARWSGAVEALGLDVLAEADAAEFLLARTEGRRRAAGDDPAQARRLAVQLGQLALALEQAGAHINEQGLSFARYMDEWRSRHDEVLGWFDERVMQYPMSVAVTWQTSFARLTEAGRRLLGMLAWFAPDPVPEWLLDAGGGPFGGGGLLCRLAAAARRLFHVLASPRDALADLAAYSLVARAGDARAPVFSVHRLVQDVARRRLGAGGGREALAAALRWIDGAFQGDPQDVRTWAVLAPLSPHAHAAALHADAAGIARPTARLMNQLGILYHARAQHAQAEPLMRRALEIDEKAFGPEHPRVATDLNNLAALLQATNRLSEAEPLMRRAVVIFLNFQAATGHEHPHLRAVVNNYAALLMQMGQGRAQIPARLNDVGKEFGIKLGGG